MVGGLQDDVQALNFDDQRSINQQKCSAFDKPLAYDSHLKLAVFIRF